MIEVDEDERHRSAVVDQVRQAREQLALARRNRPARIAAAFADAVDVQLE
jgi:PHD/YefM family antitoxin component YafN of YafNO toxin-antitoxin module